MAQEEVEVIKKIFSVMKMTPKYHEHEAVVTSEEAAKTRGVELKSGIKALLFTNGVGSEDSWVIVNVPADKKADTKKVAESLGWSKGRIRMATTEEVLERTGCEVGAVPPFGHKKRTKILVDTRVYENNESNFNIGLRTISANVPTRQMKILFEKLQAKEGDFIKE
jgi:prolyl-tRNA editing enzyme YbaK/EbsC (Cys-tRNA(Pro) deacylase)